MKKILFYSAIIMMSVFLFGCGSAKTDELINMVNENPATYLGNYDDLQYISSEYVAEKDGYFLIYQGKNNNDNIIRTYNLKSHFYNSDGEWVLHKVEKELINTYLNIVGTTWKTTPKRGWTGYMNVGEDVKILDVSEDNESISLMMGSEKINFERMHTERDDMFFNYSSVNRNQPVSLRYNTLYSDSKAKILLYFGNPTDGSMPDLEYTLAE